MAEVKLSMEEYHNVVKNLKNFNRKTLRDDEEMY